MAYRLSRLTWNWLANTLGLVSRCYSSHTVQSGDDETFIRSHLGRQS